MDKKIVIGLLVAFALLALIGSVVLTRWAETRPGASKSFTLVGEVVNYVEYPGGSAYLFSEPTAQTREEFAAYLNRSRYRLSLLTSSVETRATITFKQPLGLNETLAALGNPSTAGLEFAFSPQGGGAINYPMDQAIFQDMQGSLESPINGTGYTFRGYIAGTVTASGGKLRQIARDPRVVVVDVGPIEYEAIYPKVTVQPTRNVWMEVDGLKLLDN